MKYGSITTGIIADGLVLNIDPANKACYPGSGTTANNTISSNHNGTINGLTYNSSFINTSVWQMDGVDDYIDCGVLSAIEGVAATSMNIWVHPTNGSIRGTIGNWGNPYIGTAIDISSAACYFYADKDASGGGYGATSSGISNNTWANLTLTYDGTGASAADRLKGYKNGVNQELTITGTIAEDTTASPNRSFRIGDQHAGTGILGYVGCAQVYNRTLSANEVLHNYNALKGRFGL